MLEMDYGIVDRLLTVFAIAAPRRDPKKKNCPVEVLVSIVSSISGDPLGLSQHLWRTTRAFCSKMPSQTFFTAFCGSNYDDQPYYRKGPRSGLGHGPDRILCIGNEKSLLCTNTPLGL